MDALAEHRSVADRDAGGLHPVMPPPTRPGAPHPINVRLSWADVTALDRVVERTGYSRNEVMRLLLRIGLRHADDLAPKDTRAAIRAPPPP